MKTTFISTLALALLVGCAGSETLTQADAKALSDKDRNNAKQDDRGHKPQPMTESRLQQVLEEYNSNSDGELTWAEYNDWRKARFDDTDANGNGTVDTEEYVYEYEERMDARIETERKGQVKQTKMRFEALDKDDSRFLVWQELAASGERIFARWDANQDGVIDQSDPEPENTWQQASSKDANTKDKAEKQQRRAERRMIRMPTTHNRAGVLTLYDANDDKAVTLAEFENERRSQFHLADEDKNSQLSFDEYLAEYENRLDAAIAKTRRAAIKQTYVRFGVLDDNEDKTMTFDEFQISGKRIFTRWDKNDDGVISQADVGV